MTMGIPKEIYRSPEMMDSALKAIDEYRRTAHFLHVKLSEVVNNLIPSNFNGCAAEGYHQFYVKNVEPVIEATSETGGLAEMLNALEDICKNITKTFTAEDGIDEELAEVNNRQEGRITWQHVEWFIMQ